MELRVIKSQEQYHRYLEEARALVRRDPDPQTPEGARLELLALLIEDYEKKRFKFRKPDPWRRFSSGWSSRGSPLRSTAFRRSGAKRGASPNVIV